MIQTAYVPALRIPSIAPCGSNTVVCSHQVLSGDVFIPPNLINPLWAKGIFGVESQAVYSQTMGSWFSDLTNLNLDIGSSLQNLIGSVISGIKNLLGPLGKLLANIDWARISHVFLVELNPVHFVYQGLSTNPITGHLFGELDKFTGGLFTRLDKIHTLPGRALQGDAISKQELIEDSMFVAKIALVAASGGTAAAIISASADQLRLGYLGQTQLGQALLTVVAAGALAYAVGETVGDAVTNSAVGIARQSGEQELIKKTPLGATPLGRYIIGASTRTGAAGVTGADVTETLTQYTEDTGKSTAKQELAQQIGGPYGSQIANVVVDKGYPPVVAPGDGTQGGGSSSGDFFSSVWEEIKKSPDAIVDAIKNFNIQVSTGEINAPKIDLDPSSAGVARSGFGNPQFSLPELNIPGLEFPNPQIPSSYAGWEQLFCKVSVLVKNAKVCAQYRKKIKVGGKWMWVYLLDDGSIYWSFDDLMDRTVEYLLYAGLFAGFLIVLSGLKKKQRA